MSLLAAVGELIHMLCSDPTCSFTSVTQLRMAAVKLGCDCKMCQYQAAVASLYMVCSITEIFNGFDL